MKTDRLTFLKNSPLCTNINRIQLKNLVDAWLSFSNTRFGIYLKIQSDPKLLQIAMNYTSQELEKLSKVSPVNYRNLAKTIPGEDSDMATSDPERFCENLKKNKEKFMQVIYNTPKIFKYAADSLVLASVQDKKNFDDSHTKVKNSFYRSKHIGGNVSNSN
jgi:hypothetical protein